MGRQGHLRRQWQRQLHFTLVYPSLKTLNASQGLKMSKSKNKQAVQFEMQAATAEKELTKLELIEQQADDIQYRQLEHKLSHRSERRSFH